MLGFYQLDLFIPNTFSLKEKRFIVKSIKNRIGNKFNVSIAELGNNDKWQRTLIGIAMVASDTKFIESSFQKILNILDHDDRIEVLDQSIDYY